MRGTGTILTATDRKGKVPMDTARMGMAHPSRVRTATASRPWFESGPLRCKTLVFPGFLASLAN